MRLSSLTSLAVAPLLMLAAAGSGVAQSSEGTRISGPIVHENLAIYFIHGRSADGPVPLTLAEAMTNGVVVVRETGSVNQLEIENIGADEVFVQSGDIVKGGKQDRTLMVSLVLPPRSGRVPIAAFCVEQGRWSARGGEDAAKFSTASATVPSRKMKLAMRAPLPTAPDPTGARDPRGRPVGTGVDPARMETSVRQQAVWNSVRETQGFLGSSLSADVRSTRSASSLQLALEHKTLVGAQKAYVDALLAAGQNSDDIVGFVFAINGKLNSADIYPSNGLFRKMWAKLLNASAIEAIGHSKEKSDAAPSIETVTAFLADAEAGKASDRPLNQGAKLNTREGQQAYLFETVRAERWVHRNYLAK
jgi:hypothetical protein